MKKIAILIDSTFLMDEKYKEENNIFVIPLSINFKNASFKDAGDKNALLEEVFIKINKDKVIPKTSQPSTQDFLDMYEKIKNQGYEKILGFYLSSNLSGTYQGAINAQKIFLEKNKKFEIENYDSLNVAISSIAIKEIIEYIKITKDIKKEVIKNKLDVYSKTANILLSVDNLEYLALGGRISSSIAAIGNLFGIKPLLEIKQGKILEYTKVRSQKNAYKKMLEIFEEQVVKNKDKTFLIGSTHILNEKMAKKILNNMEKILEANNIKYERAFEDTLGAVIGIHVGPHTVGIAWSQKND